MPNNFLFRKRSLFDKNQFFNVQNEIPVLREWSYFVRNQSQKKPLQFLTILKKARIIDYWRQLPNTYWFVEAVPQE